MSMYSKCKAVIANPFSTATNQPKIPDGKAPASMGGKRNLVTQIDFDENDTFDIILSPRFDSPLYYASARQAASTPTPVKAGGATGFVDNHPFAKAFKETDTAGEILQDPAAEISKIRLVSQGCKLTLTNSTDDNDGWFEAFRFSPSADNSTYITNESQIGTDTWNPGATPKADSLFGNKDVANAIDANRDFSMNLSSKSNYVTGKLRNLHRYTWVNKPTTKDVEFKNLATRLLTGIPVNDTDHTRSYANLAFQDWDYDVIWIRVHGRGIPAVQQGGCCLPTRIMVHIAQNIECVFGEQNTLHTFMTKSPVSGGYRRAGSSLPYMPMRRYYAPMRRYARRTYTRKRATTKRRTMRKKY